MKTYIHYFMTLLVLAGSSRLATGQANKPTVKIGVFYTAKAADRLSDFGVTGPMSNYITGSVTTLQGLMATNGLNTDYEVELTASALLPVYVEPKHRPRKGGDTTYGTDEYVSISGDGTEQVFQEMTLHESFNDYYTSYTDNTLDDDLNVDALDEDEVDAAFLNTTGKVKLDVIIVVVDEEGDPLVTDGTIEDVAAGYDDPLYAVVSADYFFDDDEALAYAFFRLFCDPGYSDADLNDDAPNTYSFLSDYWTGVEGTDLLSPTNKELFKHQIGKLKLATGTSGQVVFNGPSDITFQYSGTAQDVNNNASMVFDGTTNAFAIAIPEAVYTDEGSSSTDIYGNEVQIENSYKVFTAGAFTVDPPAAPDPRFDNTPSTTPYVPPAMALPIDFDNDITAAKKSRYVSDYFGADSKVTDGTGTNKDYLTVTKYSGAAYACAETVISFVSGLSLSPTKKKLAVDIKLGANATATDKMKVILYANDGSTLTHEITLTGATITAFKTFEVEFSPTATETYTRIAIRFNDCTIGGNNKIYLVDNIGFPSNVLDLDIDFSVIMGTADVCSMPVESLPTGYQEGPVNICMNTDFTFLVRVKNNGDDVEKLSLKFDYNSFYNYQCLDESDGRWVHNGNSFSEARSWDLKEGEMLEAGEEVSFQITGSFQRPPGYGPKDNYNYNYTNSFSLYHDESLYKRSDQIKTVFYNTAKIQMGKPEVTPPYPSKRVLQQIKIPIKNLNPCNTGKITFKFEVDNDVFGIPKLTTSYNSVPRSHDKKEGNLFVWENLNELGYLESYDITISMNYIGGGLNECWKFYSISPKNATAYDAVPGKYWIATPSNPRPRCVYSTVSKSTLGTQTAKKEESLSIVAERFAIYPNPFTTTTNILLKTKQTAKKVRLEVLDMSSRLVDSKIIDVIPNIANQRLPYNGAYLEAGVYIINVWLENGVVETGKLIKQ